MAVTLTQVGSGSSKVNYVDVGCGTVTPGNRLIICVADDVAPDMASGSFVQWQGGPALTNLTTSNLDFESNNAGNVWAGIFSVLVPTGATSAAVRINGTGSAVAVVILSGSGIATTNYLGEVAGAVGNGQSAVSEYANASAGQGVVGWGAFEYTNTSSINDYLAGTIGGTSTSQVGTTGQGGTSNITARGAFGPTSIDGPLQSNLYLNGASADWSALIATYNPAAAATVVSSSFTANAYIKKAQAGSFTADAYVKKTVIPVGGESYTTTYAADAFNRSVSGSLGTADTGGVWSSIGSGVANTTNVDGSYGVLTAGTWGDQNAWRLNAVSAADLEFTARVWVGVQSPGTGVMATPGIFARSGQVHAECTLVYSGVSTLAVTVASLGVLSIPVIPSWDATGTWFRWRMKLSGGDGWVTFWKESDPEPAANWFDASGNTSAGNLGMQAWHDGETGDVYTFKWDDLLVTSARTTLPGGITADAVIVAPSGTTQTGSFTADAYVKATKSFSVTADAYIKRLALGSTFTADAYVKRLAQGSTFTADAYLSKTQPFSFTADSSIKRLGISFSFTADANVKATVSGSFTADATIAAASATRIGSFTADAYVKKTLSGSFTADAYIAQPKSFSFVADAYVLKPATGSVTADAYIKRLQSGAFTADAYLLKVASGSFTADANVAKTVSGSVTADAYVLRVQPGSFTADAYVRVIDLNSFTADAYVKATSQGSVTADAYIAQPKTFSVTADAYIKVLGQAGSFVADAYVMRVGSGSFTADAYTKTTLQGSVTADAYVRATSSGSLTADAFILRLGQPGSFTADATISKVGRVSWTTPDDGVNITASPVLGFTIPPATGPIFFRLELDTVNTFSSGSLRVYQSAFDQTGWEYYDGASWVPVTSAGVPASKAGNDARFTVPTALASATWYRRIRGAV